MTAIAPRRGRGAFGLCAAAVLLVAGPTGADLTAGAQAATVGLQRNDAGAHAGYTLFAPLGATTTYLIDMQGEIVHTWPSASPPGNAVYLLEDGSLLRTAAVRNRTLDAGGGGGRVERIGWDGELLWAYDDSSESARQHHDVEPLPDGHVLVVAWEVKTAAEARAAGRDPDLLAAGALWPDHLVEVDPATNEAVWEWHVWDHLIQERDPALPNYGRVADHPERIDLNFVSGTAEADWTHVNAVDFNPELDQIVLSAHHFSELWVIDHGTTTAEAAGPAGDLLYRWGNPQAYGAGGPADQQLFAQHDAQWIPAGLPGAGDFLVFNNGQARRRPYSTVEEIVPPLTSGGTYALAAGGAYGPAAPAWRYAPAGAEAFFAANISGAQRLPNGNTLICSGPQGEFFEVTADGQIVWAYVNPVVGGRVLSPGEAVPQAAGGPGNAVFRATRYGPEYPGLAPLFAG